MAKKKRKPRQQTRAFRKAKKRKPEPRIKAYHNTFQSNVEAINGYIRANSRSEVSIPLIFAPGIRVFPSLKNTSFSIQVSHNIPERVMYGVNNEKIQN